MHVDATTRRRGGVTLVEVQVRSDDDAPQPVRVENRLDGPVWYPRRHGEAAPGWDDAGYEGTVPAEGRLAVGYATPAAPAESPVEVTRVDDADGEEWSGAAVVAELGDPRPPRDAVAGSEANTRGDSVPAPVASWLDDVATGERDPETAAALDAVAARIERLRRPAER